MKHTGRALLVKPPWSYLIINDNKNWEIRGSRTHLRGKIDIAESGTGTVIGTVDLVDCIGPLSLEEFRTSYCRHRCAMVNDTEMPYEKHTLGCLKIRFALKNQYRTNIHLVP